jgi:hypothetical protein
MAGMSSTVTPVDRVIDRDCPCARCGYNLRTRPASGRCPECTTAARVTFQAHATRLGGADRRWLRATTNGVLWLILAMVFPVTWFWFDELPRKGLGRWMTFDGLQLAILIAPAAFAAIACWRLAARERRPAPPDERGDQPATRWALRVLSFVWFVPLLFVAGPFYDPRPYYDRPNQRLILLLSWSAVPSTLLLFRRLKYVVRRLPSRFLLAQCNAIGSQLPLAFLLITLSGAAAYRYENDAARYAMSTPIPAAGLPWVIVGTAKDIWMYYERELRPDAAFIAITFVVALTVANLILMIELVVVLIRARRADADLPAYCREQLAALAADGLSDGRSP